MSIYKKSLGFLRCQLVGVVITLSFCTMSLCRASGQSSGAVENRTMSVFAWVAGRRPLFFGCVFALALQRAVWEATAKSKCVVCEMVFCEHECDSLSHPSERHTSIVWSLCSAGASVAGPPQSIAVYRGAFIFRSRCPDPESGRKYNAMFVRCRSGSGALLKSKWPKWPISVSFAFGFASLLLGRVSCVSSGLIF
jgi:hypothetical protein